MGGWSEGQCQLDIGTTREKEVVTLCNFCLWRDSECGGTRMGPLKWPVLDHIPAFQLR